jgi:hypothetical protein
MLIHISRRDTDRKKRDIVYSLTTKNGWGTCYDLKKLKQELMCDVGQKIPDSKYHRMRRGKKEGWWYDETFPIYKRLNKYVWAGCSRYGGVSVL